MTEENTSQAPEAAQQEASPTEAQTTDTQPQAEHMIPKSRFDEINQKLKDLQVRETKALKEAEKSQREAAEKQGKFQELYEAELVKREAAELSATQAEHRRIKASIAHRHNLPDVLISRLQGETEEEMEADALILLEAMPATAEPQKPSVSGTDASGGLNTTIPAAPPSDQEIRERAVRLGVSPVHLKMSLGLEP